jgi:zinc transport system substrate-binding protein
MNILGERADNASVELLLKDGVDMHSFQPSADDIIDISTCDIFIYVGGESDEWVTDALSEAVNEDMTVLSLTDVLGEELRLEETVEGMQSEGGDEEEAAYDEHVWLSLKNAVVCCEAIEQAIAEKDPAYAEVYEANAREYIEKLEELDGRYAETIENAPNDTLIFADRFPFRYLVDDYGLKYYAAFAGCSAETEAAFETILFLSGKLSELDTTAVLTIEGSDTRLAETVMETSGRKDVSIMSLDSMQSVTTEQLEGGLTYISAMEDNLKIIADALS